MGQLWFPEGSLWDEGKLCLVPGSQPALHCHAPSEDILPGFQAAASWARPQLSDLPRQGHRVDFFSPLIHSLNLPRRAKGHIGWCLPWPRVLPALGTGYRSNGSLEPLFWVWVHMALDATPYPMPCDPCEPSRDLRVLWARQLFSQAATLLTALKAEQSQAIVGGWHGDARSPGSAWGGGCRWAQACRCPNPGPSTARCGVFSCYFQ